MQPGRCQRCMQKKPRFMIFNNFVWTRSIKEIDYSKKKLHRFFILFHLFFFLFLKRINPKEKEQMCTQLGYQLADVSSQYIFLYTSQLLRSPHAAAQLTGTCTVCPAQRSPLRNHNWFACIVCTADTHDADGCNNIRMSHDLYTSVTFYAVQ